MDKKKEYSAEEKMDIVLAILKKPKKQKQLLGKYDVGLSTYYKWKNRFIHSGLAGLEEYKRGPKSKPVGQEKIQEIAKQLKAAQDRNNELATELEILKKNESWSSEG
ncbi:MAG: transposase [Candidatus Margulisbacteria bacterium]|nr:transposase [Candidatus Margulisiibacteriota bacterium]MBU2101752.1 transposase [Patescibacteria group bacterium]